ncbi:MAG: CHAD domain-containing protein [Methanoregulaceae archaeon]|nr:CHAD domain-containing protein [Methanoregulaceae archaeon]
MKPKRADRGGPGFCAYGMKYIMKGYMALKTEVKGAKSGGDPGHVHRMRVASRRLRAALPVFSSCFPEGKYRKWSRAVRLVTTSLGRARDLDVQVTFLDDYIRNLKGEELSAPYEKAWKEADLSGLAALLGKLKAERTALQPGIEAIARLFSEKGAFSDLPVAIRLAKACRSSVTIRERALRETRKRSDALIAFAKDARDPDAIEAHHAMRIAAKKFRYTMEIFNEACDGSYDDLIQSVRRLQEILGSIHDCDVWILVLEEEYRSGENIPRGKKGDKGLNALLCNRKNQRKLLYQEFVGLWDEFCEQHYPDMKQSPTG